jgi:U4/U6.U5 tri-snRNP component SNU23
MSMKVERSSLDQVRDRFCKNKRKAEEKKDEPSYDLQTQLKNASRAEEERKEQQKKRKKKNQNHDDDERDEDDMARIMGFGGFGGAKKNN